MSMFEGFFKLKEHNTNVKTEVMAGITTFMTMAYILIVNPNILSATGMDAGGANEDCGCDHDHDHGENMIYLTTEEGEEMACAVLGVFDFEGQEYIALLPENTETAFIYGFNEDGEEIELTRIEDEDHYQKVSDVFMSIWDEEEAEEEA